MTAIGTRVSFAKKKILRCGYKLIATSAVLVATVNRIPWLLGTLISCWLPSIKSGGVWQAGKCLLLDGEGCKVETGTVRLGGGRVQEVDEGAREGLWKVLGRCIEACKGGAVWLREDAQGWHNEDQGRYVWV